MKFAVSILASRNRRDGNGTITQNTVGMIEAASRAEAVGLCIPLAHRFYPDSAGWYAHHVTACTENDFFGPNSILLPNPDLDSL